MILSVILGLGNWMLFMTGSAFSRMTGNTTETTVISVVVMKDNEAETIEDIKDGKFGSTETGDQEILQKAINDVEKDAGQSITKVSYQSYKDIGDDLTMVISMR